LPAHSAVGREPAPHQMRSRSPHRGKDPYSYHSEKDDSGRRQLVPTPSEADDVRAVFRELGHSSFDVIARERGWSTGKVKDLYRRRRLYLGFVIEKRGLDERPGRHEPLIDLATYETAMAGVASRRRNARGGQARRTYLLTGLLACEGCGGTLHGNAKVSRGREWRYYRCRRCRIANIAADEQERRVLAAVAGARLPGPLIDKARRELHRRLAGPAPDQTGRRRKRLEQRLVRLKEQYGWGDLTLDEYRQAIDETRRMIDDLATHEKVLAFDRNRDVVTTLPEALSNLPPVRQRDLLALVVESIPVRDGQADVSRIEWAPPLRPFFDRVMAPPDGFEPPTPALGRLRSIH
jgi:Recombinase zinc beta ribbon domain